MNGRSKTSPPKTQRDLFSAISLRELGSGAFLCVWPDGKITEKYGREVARASLSARLAKALGLMTSGTYGPPSIGSLESVALTKSLANRLQARTDCIGSILYQLTWKERATPSGRSIPALRGSPRRISGKGATGTPNGWTTPSASDGKRGGELTDAMTGSSLRQQAPLAGWPTPLAADQRGSAGVGKTELPNIAFLAGWPTPCQQDGPNGGPNQGADRLPGCAPLAGWPTPKAATGGPDYAIFDRPNTGSPSPATVATFALHPSAGTAQTLEYRFTPSIIGQIPTGSSAVIPTVRVGGPLNPAHSLWLMLGPYATDWLKCAERVTRSTSRKRKAS